MSVGTPITLVSTSDTKHVNWTEFEAFAGAGSGRAVAPQEVTDEVDEIKKAHQLFQDTILASAKKSAKVNLKFLAAAQVSAFAAKDQAAMALLAPYVPKRAAPVAAPSTPRAMSD